MTWSQIEHSVQDADPFYLFKFVRGLQEWLYTDAEFTVVYEEDVYTPLEIKLGSFGAGSSNDHAGSVDIDIPTDSDIGQLFQEGDLTSAVDIRVFSMFRSLIGAPKIILLGEVMFGTFAGSQGSLTVAPLQSLMDSEIPQGTMQKNHCIWQTYDFDTCGVIKEDFTFTGTVDSILEGGLHVAVAGSSAFVPNIVGGSALPDMFVGGVAQVGVYKVGIRSQFADTMILRKPIPGLLVGDIIFLTAGDDHRPTTCRDKFHNAGNMMVHPDMPQQSPWYGQGLRV